MIHVKVYYSRREDGVKAWAYINQDGVPSSMPFGPAHFTHQSFDTLMARYTGFEWEDLEPQHDITMRD